MENFVVSARKYRPAQFLDVVGQQAITGTLENAIKNNHLAQAFLFCGPRGVGKTTCARILARLINEQNNPSETANEDYAFNIFELDAASNNSVEDIRNLIDQVRIPPQVGTHKVYIIDEVHMLSQAAFNAFLKTLEEPPAHAIFILATTEKHKIIPTILSRCQIFDFNRIQVKDMAAHLQDISEKENIQAEPDALHTIAQKADGSLRDALSIFDQLVSFAGNNLTYAAVIENLNILDYDYYFRLTTYFINGNTSGALLLFSEILDKGFDGHNFVTGLAEHIRNLLVCKDEATLQLLEVGETIQEKYKEQAAQCTQQFLLKCLELLNECDVQYKQSKNKNLRVELVLLKLCSLLQAEEKKTVDEPVKIKKPEPEQVQQVNPNKENQILQAEELRPATESVVQEIEKQTAEEQNKALTVVGGEIETEQLVNEIVPDEQEEDAETSRENAPVKQTDVKKVTLQIKQESSFTKEVIEAPNVVKEPTPKKEIQFETESISQLFNKPEQPIEETKEENTITEVAKTEAKENQFSYDDLTTAWSAFAKTTEEEKPSLYKILVRTQPALKEDTIVEFTVGNTVEQELFDEAKQNLLEFLQKQLNNNKLGLVTLLEKEENKGRQLYTTRDKYLYLLEKNPNLQKLKDRLDLDIDF